MIYKYITPEGISDIIIEKENGKVIKMFFDNIGFDNTSTQEYFVDEINWLDDYFQGKIPTYKIQLNLTGLTDFQKEVLDVVDKIPYGKVLTYGNIADIISMKRGCGKISAQAVGNAVKHNPILLFIPCHRVLGSGNKLVGYYGGLDNKRALLNIEKIQFTDEFK